MKQSGTKGTRGRSYKKRKRRDCSQTGRRCKKILVEEAQREKEEKEAARKEKEETARKEQEEEHRKKEE